MGTRLLTKSDIAAVLSMSDCIDAVEAAFLAHAKGETIPPGVLASHVTGGGFHVKTAGMKTSRAYYVAKVITGSLVVADIRDQCATIGDLHHAIEERRMKATDIHGELADVVSGRVPGRRSDAEITVFDSTGTALEDVAAAAWAYERAGKVREIDFSG